MCSLISCDYNPLTGMLCCQPVAVCSVACLKAFDFVLWLALTLAINMFYCKPVAVCSMACLKAFDFVLWLALKFCD